MVAYVALGGAIGAVMRYGLGRVMAGVVDFPLATLLANVSGSLCIGLAFVAITQRWGDAHPLHGLLIVGVLGGFTTFSSFSLDALRLMEAGRVAAAGGYVAGSVLLSLGAAYLGMMLGQRAIA